MNEKTALISVTDKKGLDSFAKVLKGSGYSILASSGTKKYLEGVGVEAEEIAEYTRSPEILGGRVKTLHPKIHGGILADRDDAEHVSALTDAGIRPIDVVIVNLYPFREKYASGALTEREMIEFIDIGGVALIRAAAKNFLHVAIVTSPDQYAVVAEEIESRGRITLETRRRLASEAFRLTSAYDASIVEFFADISPSEDLPDVFPIGCLKEKTVRYGENPHQKAALYRAQKRSYLLDCIQHQGKELSFNNYIDIVGAFSLARDLGAGGVGIIKHTNPCGAALKRDLLSSFKRALACDPVSAFGGIVAANGVIGKAEAEAMLELFLEVIIARGFDESALEVFARKKNLRVISIPERYWDDEGSRFMALYVAGSLLYQEMDKGFPEMDQLEVVTSKKPTDEELEACKLAWKIAKHVKSNAIVIADGEGSVGIGAGQMSRVDASRIAVEKALNAGFDIAGDVAASDAFFPFPDGVLELAKKGIRAIIQPGGSIRDKQVIEAADEAGIAMIMTGRRHFRHL
jgi:phosphoribosylaminoimidazolecarboxamide formyltransferase/IMP cyclohydrolase